MKMKRVSPFMSVCSNHFADEDYFLLNCFYNTPKKRKVLKKNSVPSRNLPTDLPTVGIRNSSKPDRKFITKATGKSARKPANVYPGKVSRINRKNNGAMIEICENSIKQKVEIKEEPTQLTEPEGYQYPLVKQQTDNQNLGSHGSIEQKCDKCGCFKGGTPCYSQTEVICKIYRCELCDKLFNSRYYFSKHFITHTSEDRHPVCKRHKKYNCKLCVGYMKTDYCNEEELQSKSCEAETKHCNNQHRLNEQKGAIPEKNLTTKERTEDVEKCYNEKDHEYVFSCGEMCDNACLYECSKKINKSAIKTLFTNFWNIRDFQKQDSYIFNCIQKVPVKHKKDPKDLNRQHSYIFKVNIDGKVIHLCQKSFLSVHGLQKSRCRINNIIKHVKDNIPPVDKQGKHSQMANLVSEDQIQIIHNHLTLITGGVNPKDVDFTDSSIMYMYREHYVKYCKDMNLLPVSKHDYRQVFSENYIKRTYLL